MSRHATFITRGTLGSPKREPAAVPPPEETCDFCAEPIPPEHRHLLEIATRQVVCVCQACSILFHDEAASDGRFRMMSDRRLSLDDFQMDEVQWESLRIPVSLAFFFHSTPDERVIALYPSPMGPVESRLHLSTWEELERENTSLREMTPDVEALLVDRTGDEPRYYLVPIEDCFRLVAVIRTRWRGLSGGRDVWEEVERFFDNLRKRSRPLPRHG